MGNNTTPKCQCPYCNNIGTHKYAVRRRGGGNAFMCDIHAIENESYYLENNNFQGTPKAHGMTIGREFETDYASQYARLEMMLQGWLPTHDSSINGPEFKSCIMHGFNTIKAFNPTIDELIESEDIRLCYEEYRGTGTHTHIGHITLLNSLTMSYIRRFYHSLFVPLCEKMQENPLKVKRIFGRNFVYYASPINRQTDAEEHTNFINVQHNNTLEWRLCQYRNAEQDSHCIDVIAEMSAKVFHTFCSKVLEMGLSEGQKLTDEQKEELKKAADKTAKQIVKVWEKA